MKYSNKKQLGIALRVYTGQILVGFAMGWSAPELKKLKDEEKTPLPAVITEDQASLVGALLYLGCIVGPYLTGFLNNAKGRKISLILSGTIGTLSFVMLALTRNLQMLMASRIIVGICIGMVFVLNFVYVGEIASPNIRGILLYGVGLSASLGILLVYSVGPFVSFGVVAYIGILISVLFTSLSLTVPESPMFYVLKGDLEKAKQTLIELGREDEVDSLAQKQGEIKKTTFQDWKEIFTIKTNLKTFYITFTLNSLQQLSGVVAVMFYATDIFEMAGSSVDPAIATILIGVAQVIANVIATMLVDRSGRKILLMCSSVVCALSLATLGTYFYFFENGYDVARVAWLPLVTLMVYFLFYSFGLSAIPQTLVGEMYTPNVRSSGSTVTITTAFLVGFVVSATFSAMISGMGGYGTFWLFSGACVVAFIFTAVFVPETKQKTLDEILEILSK